MFTLELLEDNKPVAWATLHMDDYCNVYEYMS